MEELIQRALLELEVVSGFAASYHGASAVFYRWAPQDAKQLYPRLVFDLHPQSREGAEADGVLQIEILSKVESKEALEAVAEGIAEGLSDQFLTGAGQGIAPVFFQMEPFLAGEGASQYAGVRIWFDTFLFEKQEEDGACPAAAMNVFLKKAAPGCVLLGYEETPFRVLPSEEVPFLYVRRNSTKTDKGTYQTAWLLTELSVFIFAGSVWKSRSLALSIQKALSIEKELMMENGSPAFLSELTEQAHTALMPGSELLAAFSYGMMREMEEKEKLNNIIF